MRCRQCKGTGEITVAGGDWDEQIPDVCPDCDGSGVR